MVSLSCWQEEVNSGGFWPMHVFLFIFKVFLYITKHRTNLSVSKVLPFVLKPAKKPVFTGPNISVPL